MEKTLTCIRCGLPFTYDKGRPPLRCDSCKAVHKREKGAARQTKWREANRDRHVQYLRDYHQARKDDPEYRRKRREGMVFYKYGVMQAEVDALIAAQGGKCAICGGERNGPGTRLHIDHCHDSGKVRGMLCGKCNTAVGLLDDNPVRAEALAAYLRRNHMAYSPSQRWENGVLVERAIESNRWAVNPDGTAVENDDDVEAKRVGEAENKAVQSAETKKPAKKRR